MPIPPAQPSPTTPHDQPEQQQPEAQIQEEKTEGTITQPNMPAGPDVETPVQSFVLEELSQACTEVDDQEGTLPSPPQPSTEERPASANVAEPNTVPPLHRTSKR
ncbi:hypothetical protein L7F22_046498 [Adiantum nelumboides]|nr:hypothetical protein [Adiantum nelumboides]